MTKASAALLAARLVIRRLSIRAPEHGRPCGRFACRRAEVHYGVRLSVGSDRSVSSHKKTVTQSREEVRIMWRIPQLGEIERVCWLLEIEHNRGG